MPAPKKRPRAASTRKKALSAAPMLQSSTRTLEGFGTKGSKPRPWNYELAARQYQAWAYAAAIRNAFAFASVPQRLYTRRRSGTKLFKTRQVPRHLMRYLLGEAKCQPSKRVMTKAVEFAGDLEEVVDPHPLMTLLQVINRDENGYGTNTLKMLDWQISGNHYQFVVTTGMGIPTQLWRMPPQWTRVIPAKNPTDTLIQGYLYGARTDVEREFRRDEVDQYKMPNPKGDLYYGMGWYEAGWSALGLHGAKREHDTAKMDNMARPDWLMSFKNGASKDDLDTAEAGIKQKFKGTDKTGDFLLIGGDIDLKALQWDVPELGTPTRVIEEISAVSGVPVAMLLSNDPNKSSSQTARLGWLRDVIQPYCTLDDEITNQKYVSRWPDAEEMFVARDPVAFEDQAEQLKRIVGLHAGGIITANEGRAELGYEPKDGGDNLYPPSGTTGGAAAVAGDQSPGQNDERHNETAPV